MARTDISRPAARAAHANRLEHVEVIITCEHGGNRIPKDFQRHFANQQKILRSHRGYDAGALQLARTLSRHFDAPLIFSDVSRLLIDLNRSLHHRALHAPWIRRTPQQQRQELIASYYLPYRSRIEEKMAQAIRAGKTVLHISAHSFTPVLDGIERNADIGLLYDPAQIWEAPFCRAWQAQIKNVCPRLRVRRNYPYLGKADGLVTYLRQRFPAQTYIGIELEASQNLMADERLWRAYRRRLASTLDATLFACKLRRD